MGKMGDTPARFLALDLNAQKLAWDIRSRVPQSSGQLATAGGLVFSATADRYLRAFDDKDGKVLWESGRLNDIPNAFPITYHGRGQAVHRDAGWEPPDSRAIPRCTPHRRMASSEVRNRRSCGCGSYLRVSCGPRSRRRYTYERRTSFFFPARRLDFRGNQANTGSQHVAIVR